MYAREENNKIVRYSTLPKQIRDSNGKLIMGVRNADEATLKSLGFYPLVLPTYNAKTHERTSKIVWDTDKYTYEVVSLNKTVDNLKKELLAELKSYWKTAFEEGKPYSDYLKATNQNMPSDVETEINAAYTMLGTLKAQIKGITTMEAALAFKFPESDINEKLDYMRELI